MQVKARMLMGGGALATVLNEIIDAIPEGGGSDVLKLVDGQDGVTCKLPWDEESGGWNLLNIQGVSQADIVAAIQSGKVVSVYAHTIDNDMIAAVSGFVYYNYNSDAPSDELYFIFATDKSIVVPIVQ